MKFNILLTYLIHHPFYFIYHRIFFLFCPPLKKSNVPSLRLILNDALKVPIKEPTTTHRPPDQSLELTPSGRQHIRCFFYKKQIQFNLRNESFIHGMLSSSYLLFKGSFKASASGSSKRRTSPKRTDWMSRTGFQSVLRMLRQTWPSRSMNGW